MPISSSQYDRIASGLKRKTKPLAASPNVDPEEDIFGDRDYVPIGAGGVLAASEKLLHINQGVIEPDYRDEPQYKRLYSTPHLLKERIRLDAGQLKRNMVRHIVRQKSLNPVHAFIMDPYMDGYFFGGNPLNLPLEEINPIHILEQSRRITQMGPGGIGSMDSVTPGMQAVDAGNFGFVDPISGPESSLAGVDVRAAWGTKYGMDGRIYQKVRDNKSGKKVWVSPEDLDQKTLGLPL